MMEAIILAGGFGTRLREVIVDLPKPMAPISGKPFLEILLSNLAQKGFKRVVLSVGYKSEVIISHFGNQYNGVDIAYVVEDSPLGTGGAVRFGLSQCVGDHVFVFNGDTFLDLEISMVDIMWQKSKQPIIVAREVPDTTRYGRLIVEGNQVTGFSEKGIAGPGLINAGCYVIGAGQLDAWSLGKPFSLETDYFARAVPKTEVNVYVTEGIFIDIGIPEDYFKAQALLAGRR